MKKPSLDSGTSRIRDSSAFVCAGMMDIEGLVKRDVPDAHLKLSVVDLHLRWIGLSVAQKDDSALPGVRVVLLPESIGDQVLVQDVHLAVGVDLLDERSVLHAVGAARTAAIVNRLLGWVHALDHDDLA
jgi:hypothetical protein